MNQDLQKLLELRANMSYLYGLRKQKKEEMTKISKHIEYQKFYIKQDKEKYKNNLKVKPQFIVEKAELERLEKKKSDFPLFGDFVPGFCFNNYGDFSYGFFLPTVLGGILGIVMFFIFKEPWLHISSWANTVTFTVIFHALALAVFAALFAAAALFLTGLGFFIAWLVCVPIRFRRKKKIERIKYKLFGTFNNRRSPYITDEKAKKTI